MNDQDDKRYKAYAGIILDTPSFKKVFTLSKDKTFGKCAIIQALNQ